MLYLPVHIWCWLWYVSLKQTKLIRFLTLNAYLYIYLFIYLYVKSVYIKQFGNVHWLGPGVWQQGGLLEGIWQLGATVGLGLEYVLGKQRRLTAVWRLQIQTCYYLVTASARLMHRQQTIFIWIENNILKYFFLLIFIVIIYFCNAATSCSWQSFGTRDSWGRCGPARPQPNAAAFDSCTCAWGISIWHPAPTPISIFDRVFVICLLWIKKKKCHLNAIFPFLNP